MTAEKTGGVCMPCKRGIPPALLAAKRKEGWTGVVKAYSRQDVEAAVNQVFSEAERGDALGYLDLYSSKRHPLERERVQMAIVDLSGGDLDRLVRFVDVALTDFRDVLVWSECPTCRHGAR